ncbi:hypothetical protein ILYODFUR_011344, partial [Ilyodon furcidens]
AFCLLHIYCLLRKHAASIRARSSRIRTGEPRLSSTCNNRGAARFLKFTSDEVPN